jgi:UDP-N-acetylglucosamine 2-epimerase (hydrolysing)
LTLLKNAQFIIGNSSAGIREAPYYGIPIINVGTRQQNRSFHSDIVNIDYSKKSIQNALSEIDSHKIQNVTADFGTGNSTQLFVKALENSDIWSINHQKQFRDSQQ